MFKTSKTERIESQAPRERLACGLPDLVLPGVEFKWTQRELESLARLISAPEANSPTDALIRSMKD